MAELVESFEALDWRLDQLHLVWVQTEDNASLGGAAHIGGAARAHLLFRRPADPRSRGASVVHGATGEIRTIT